MRGFRVALALCGLTLALVGAGCQCCDKHNDPCARQGGVARHKSHGGFLDGCCLDNKKQACGQPECKDDGCCLFGGSCCTSKSECGQEKGCCNICKGGCNGRCNGVCNGGPCGCVKYAESTMTNLGVGVRQKMNVGEIQVDECKLERILDSRKRQRAEEQRCYDEYVRAQEQFYRNQREQQLRSYIDSLSVAGDCCRPANCCPPAIHCCELPPPPPEMPLRPAEIPMMIPVTLEVGVEGTCLGQPSVCRVPLPPAPPKRPCCPPRYPTCPPCATQPMVPSAMPPAPMTGIQSQPYRTPAAAPAGGRATLNTAGR